MTYAIPKVIHPTNDTKKPRCQFTASELEDIDFDWQEPLPKVVRSADVIKRHRYRFTAQEIEEFEPDLKI
ncbi:MAG: hypothetical protein KME26_05345 [Oscillatoria princeps RMCB-10]|jgi:hypothetical protein|nr:hypothetical protein [Oscillatoria princeps RMCB-10]